MKVPAQSAASEDQKTALRMALPSSDATFPAQHSLLLFLFTYGDIFGGSGNKFLHMGALGWEDPLEKGMVPTPVFLPGEFHGQRSLPGPRAHIEGCTTERLTLSLSR